MKEEHILSYLWRHVIIEGSLEMGENTSIRKLLSFCVWIKETIHRKEKT
jgi:hypothetical protein